MKTTRILQMVIAIVFIVTLASCAYSYYPPHSAASYSLIVSPGPGIYATRYYDGRYYYRSPEGYTYWRGYDNRYYLDRAYIGKVHYGRREYNEWNKYYRHHR